jgi:hypothetical protein
MFSESLVKLVGKWHYVEQDARRLSPATKAWMAAPLVLPGSKIQGILYLDSKDRDYFGTARRQVVIGAAYGVALFASQRYSNV